MRLRVLYHGNCFDGCSSAGVFTRFYRERVAKAPVEVAYRPLEHKGAAQPFSPDCSLAEFADPMPKVPLASREAVINHIGLGRARGERAHGNRCFGR